MLKLMTFTAQSLYGMQYLVVLHFFIDPAHNWSANLPVGVT